MTNVPPATLFSGLLDKLNQPHLRYDDIKVFFSRLSETPSIRSEVIAYSFERRPIHLLSMGHGPISILAWTQMHGDEATATAAVFDLIDLLHTNTRESVKDWQQGFTIHIIPMLNPDGAEHRTRQNAQGIDINRDALALQSPEGRLLMTYVKKLKPDIGFNLHDQSPYYQCGISGNPATIAFLAPAFELSNSIDGPRKRAMHIIAAMNSHLQSHIPQCVARYNDTFSARSFGDNIAALGVSTILIESGAAKNDPNRQIARKMNVEAICAALEYLLANKPSAYSVDNYFAIPENISDAVSSLLLKNLFFGAGNSEDDLEDNLEGDLEYKAENNYHADVSIKQSERYSNEYFVDFIGDAGIVVGLNNVQADRYCFKAGKVFEVKEAFTLSTSVYLSLIKQGFLIFHDPKGFLEIATDLDVCLHHESISSDSALKLHQPAYFLLASKSDNSTISAAVLNGSLIDLSG